MSHLLPLIAALLIVIRPLSGCCECHAPLISAIMEAWHQVDSGEHHADCCQHSAPATGSEHHDEKCPPCPSCESNKEFVKVASPQVVKATSLGWHFSSAIVPAPQSILPACCRLFSTGPLADAGLRAHLVLGVMLI